MKLSGLSDHVRTGDKEAELGKSPFLEQLLEKDLEVLFLTDAIDEYMMSNLPEYDERKFQNAAKDDLKLGGKKGKKDKRVRVRLVCQTCKFFTGNAMMQNDGMHDLQAILWLACYIPARSWSRDRMLWTTIKVEDAMPFDCILVFVVLAQDAVSWSPLRKARCPCTTCSAVDEEEEVGARVVHLRLDFGCSILAKGSVDTEDDEFA